MTAPPDDKIIDMRPFFADLSAGMAAAKDADAQMLVMDMKILGYPACHAVSARLGKMCERKAGHEGRHGWMGRDGWESWTKCVRGGDDDRNVE